MIRITLLIVCGLFGFRRGDCPNCHRPEPAPDKQVQAKVVEEPMPKPSEIFPDSKGEGLKVIPPSEGGNLATKEFELFIRIQKVRLDRKLPKLKINQTLQRCARYRNPLMHDGNAHEPHGVTCSGALNRAGYKWQGCSEIFDSWANSPADAINDWKHSPGHWGAIIGRWKECGVAFKGNNATVIFANPR